LLGKEAPDPVLMAGSVVVLSILLMAGAVYFKHMERQFADVI
jgi:hypothetical protein